VVTVFSQQSTASGQLAGAFSSKAPVRAGDGSVGVFKYNVRYNDRFEFASDVENTARLFSLLTDAESVPFVTREEFSNAGALFVAGSTMIGRSQPLLGGEFFYNSTRLTGGRVGHRGIELHITGQMPATAITLRSYCEYLRVARLRNGKFELFNA